MPRTEVTIRADGQRVLILRDGRIVFDMPWDAAKALASGVAQKAKDAEEYAKANRIIYDQAICTRMGLPFGLTRRWDMLKEACKVAVTDRTLRRFLTGKRAAGIESQSVVGTPSLLQHRSN